MPLQTVKTLNSNQGEEVSVALENWGSGLDELRRRWTLEADSWQCVDGRDFAEDSGSQRLKITGDHTIRLQATPLGLCARKSPTASLFAPTPLKLALVLAVVVTLSLLQAR